MSVANLGYRRIYLKQMNKINKLSHLSYRGVTNSILHATGVPGAGSFACQRNWQLWLDAAKGITPTRWLHPAITQEPPYQRQPHHTAK